MRPSNQIGNERHVVRRETPMTAIPPNETTCHNNRNKNNDNNHDTSNSDNNDVTFSSSLPVSLHPLVPLVTITTTTAAHAHTYSRTQAWMHKP
eukprot:m.207706 g.207706  ORF g.207706 m.207706 type:complete len:93 (-) comp32990_c0_seq1:255-533(-)